MAEIKNTATGETGHQVTGKVAILYGTVKAISPDGTVRILKLNSPVYSDDRIITGDDGSVSIVFNTFPSTQLDLGRVSEVTIDDDVYGAVTPEVTAEASAEQKAIQDALLAGDQPIEVDPTAAGAEASSGGGHPTFVVSTDWSIVTPESGAETTGVTWGTQGTQLYSPMEQENSTPAITVDPGNGPDGGDGGTTPGTYDGGTGGSGVIGGVTYINDVVYEAGLPDGSDAGKTTIATGTFTVSDPDGLNGITSVTINGTEIPINELVGTEIDGNYGTLTIKGYNSSTGEGTYSYELTSATTDGPGTETDAFTLTTTDQDGATSDPAVINIEIADDLPNAVDDFDSIDEDSTTPITGNVFSNDVHPNGQPGADTPATFDTWTGNTTAQYGTFVPGADGTYTYTLDNNNPAVQGLGDGQTLTETFTYQIHDADGDIDTATLTIVINGADEQPIVGITSGTDLGGGSAVEGNPITFTVYLDKAVDVDTTVTVKVVGVAGDTATPGADYTPISTLTVTIPNGSTSATFDVSTLVDQLLEGSETFTAEIVSASNANGAVEIGTGSAIGTILDNYIPPVISIGTGAEGGSAVEGNPVTFTVSLDKASDADTTVTVKVVGVAGDTATPGADYTTISTYDVVILKGQTSATFTVDTLTDNIKEGSEYFTAEIVDASNPIGTINIGTASAVGTILDDYNNTQPTTAVSYAYVDDDGLAGDNPASTLGDYAVPNTDGDASEATFSGTLNFTTGNLPATINAFSEMDGKTGNVGQETVTYSWNDTTDTLTATVSAGARVGTFLFTVQMTDTTTGAYKVTLLDNVLHETLNGLSGDNTENDASATLNYTVTDNDGETATGTLSIVFDDDMPTATAKEHTVTVQSPESTGVIGNLAAGWTTPLDTHVLTNSSLTYSDDADSYYEKISWGANGNYSSYEFHDATISNVHIDESFNLGTFTHNNFPIQSGTAISTASLIVTFNLTVGGETIHVEHTVQFNHNETPNDGADPRDIVTIVNGTNQVDVTVGDYTYTLNIGFADSSFNPVTQVYTVENNSNTFNLVGKLTASLDNEPTATGVIGAADANFGADGAASPKIVAITHDGITYDTGDLVGNKLTITTHEGGKFEINFSTGEYKYTAPSGESYVDRSEVFTYTVEDADGDMASSTITMNVPGEDVPTVNENLLVQLDDDALAGGNAGGVGDATPDTAHTSGTLAHDFGGDGAGSIAYLTSGAPSGFTYELSGGNLLVKQGTTTVMTLTVNSTTGAYTITQNVAIDHTALQAENDQEFTINYRVTDSNGDSADGTLLINVDDDTPIAGAQNVFVEADTSTVGTNLLIVLDVSGSMDYASGVTGYTRLGLAKEALGKLIDEYSGHGDVMVRLVTFSDSAAKVGSVWMTVAEAKAAINSLSANGSTNYDAPLTTAIDAFDDAGALVGAQNISYFLSDGDPNRPTGSVGINSSEQNTWETFLKHNDITSFALGMGQIIQPSALQPIAYDGLNEVQIDSVVVTDLSQLSSVLLGTVIIPSSIEGELITGAVDTSFGADGNNTYKIVSVEYNGTTHGTGELVGNQLTIDTTVGGKLIVDFTTGHYSYTAPDGLTDSAQETFTYTIQDGDGDTASNALKIQVLPEDSTQDYSASASGVTATATVDEPNIIGSDHNDTLTGDSNANFLFGGEGDDSISGGDGNDTLSGGTGNNSLAGGAGADTFVITNGAHDTIFEYSKADLDKVDISHVLNEDAGDYLNVVKGDDGVHVKLEVLNSSGVEKASVTFANIDYSSLDSSDSAHLLDSLLAKVDVDHDG